MSEVLDCPFCGSKAIKVLANASCTGCGVLVELFYWQKRSVNFPGKGIVMDNLRAFPHQPLLRQCLDILEDTK